MEGQKIRTNKKDGIYPLTELKIEIAEGDDLHKNCQQLEDIDCQKNPGHKGFIPMEDLKLEDLPEAQRNEEKLQWLKKMGERVVRLVIVKKVKGQGFVLRDKKTNEYYIKTSCSLVKSDFSVQHCSLMFSFPEGFVPSKGKELKGTTEAYSYFNFHPVPGNLDEEMIKCKEKHENLMVSLEVLKPLKFGTGYLSRLYEDYIIETNNHVIKSNEEAANCLVEFYFDSLDRKNVITSRGTEIIMTCPIRDICHFSFSPIPEFVKDFQILNPDMLCPFMKILYKDGHVNETADLSFETISYMIEFFTNTDINDPEIAEISIHLRDGKKCEVYSNFITFDPIPEDIQSMTHQMLGYHHPELQFHGQDEQTNEIQGTIIYTFDKIVLLLTKAVTSEEAKNCRVFFPKGEKSHGTGLYFYNLPSIEYFKDYVGMDLERELETCPLTVWILEFRPWPPELEELAKQFSSLETAPDLSLDMAVIGHPHGCRKMVSFGVDKGDRKERYNDAGKRVGDDEDGKDILCINYTCPTCVGSSGSVLLNFANSTFSHHDGPKHFLGCSVEVVEDGVSKRSNQNKAWAMPSGE